MATHSTPNEPKPLTIILSNGESVTLDADYFRQQDEDIRARLAAPPLTDEELVQRRAAHPDEAWLWTRASQDALRQADERHAAGIHGTIYDSDEAFQAALDGLDADNADV